jgi:hypothetical protein
MTTAKLQVKHTAIHDLKRDWDGWSLWERRAIASLAVASFIFSIFWLAMSLELVL